jgi:hypothetical protein
MHQNIVSTLRSRCERGSDKRITKKYKALTSLTAKEIIPLRTRTLLIMNTFDWFKRFPVIFSYHLPLDLHPEVISTYMHSDVLLISLK